MRSGFSLVELSIVLVILGLLVGGALAGQSLIRAAELRSVTTDSQKYQAAVNTFRDKYFALPGDMPNATAFWGAAHATPATCKTTVGAGVQTCNGDGNGQVGYDFVVAGGEQLLIWQHLANSGLIEGSYAVGGPEASPGVNVPKTRLASNAGWGFRFFDASTALDFLGAQGHLLTIGGINPYDLTGPVLVPGDAWNIDIKMDDGLPHQGRVRTLGLAWRPDCTIAETAYKISHSGRACPLTFQF